MKPPRNSQKGFVPIVILFIVLALGVGAGTLYLQKSSSPKQEDKTSDPGVQTSGGTSQKPQTSTTAPNDNTKAGAEDKKTEDSKTTPQTTIIVTPTPTPTFTPIGSGPAQTPTPQASAAKLSKKALAVIYDPTLLSGKKLHEEAGWNDPVSQTNQVVQAINKSSGGVVNYSVEFTTRNEWPPLIGKPRNTEETYKKCRGIFSEANTTDCESGVHMDYAQLWSEQNLCSRVSNGEVDTVFLYGPAYAGWDEFAYKIPGNKFPYNAPSNYWLYYGRNYNIPDCNGKTIFVMGWIYQRGTAEALHSFGHWVETALAMSVGRGSWDATCTSGGDFNKFSCINKDIKSGSPMSVAGCGNVHYPPNGTSDYDYANQAVVKHTCDSFVNYPFSAPSVKQENCTAWGCNQQGYLEWWMARLPRNNGAEGGNLKNWWKYIVDFDNAVTEAKK